MLLEEKLPRLTFFPRYRCIFTGNSSLYEPMCKHKFHYRKGDNLRSLSIGKIYSYIGDLKAEALLGVYALSGADHQGILQMFSATIIINDKLFQNDIYVNLSIRTDHQSVTADMYYFSLYSTCILSMCF